MVFQIAKTLRASVFQVGVEVYSIPVQHEMLRSAHWLTAR